jgi:hypothetical protein
MKTPKPFLNPFLKFPKYINRNLRTKFVQLVGKTLDLIGVKGGNFE